MDGSFDTRRDPLLRSNFGNIIKLPSVQCVHRDHIAQKGGAGEIGVSMTALGSSEERVLIVESDSDFAQQIQMALRERGVSADIVNDANGALSYVKSSSPNLLVLCVELPGRSGYSVCNKLKKTKDYQGIPIIIMSSEATPEVFERHRELKSRADDYVIKPIAVGALLDRMATLMPTIADGSGEYGVPAEQTIADSEFGVAQGDSGSQEIVIGDDDDNDGIVVEEPEPQAVNVDRDIEAATDAAFAAISIDDGGSGAAVSPKGGLGSQNSDPISGLSSSGSAPPPLGDASAEIAIDDNDLRSAEANAVALSEPLSTATTPSTSGRRVADDGGSRGPDPELLARIDRAEQEAERAREAARNLEQDNERLQAELTEARSKATQAQQAAQSASETASAGTLSKDRELLSLREVINKKEKEILDLKDDLDAKERQILDQRDKVRALEHRAQEMDDKLLTIEKEMVSGRELNEALEKDKQQVIEREQSLKSRLDQAKTEIEKAYAEIETLNARFDDQKKSFAAELEELERKKAEELEQVRAESAAEVDRLRGQQIRELEELKQQNAEQLATAKAAHQEALDVEKQKQEELIRQHEEALSDLETQHRVAVEEVRQQGVAELRNVAEQHAAELEQQKELHQEEQNKLAASHRSALEEQAAGHHTALEQLKQEHTAKVLALEEEHHEAIEAKEAQFAGEKESLRTEHLAELDRLKGVHEQASNQLKAEHQEDVERIKLEHEKAISSLQSEHQQSLAELERQHKDQVAGMEARHKEKAAELDAKVDELEADLTATRSQASELEETIRLHENRIREYEGRLANAMNKIRHDDDIADKAKRALAVGIALLEEQQKLSVAPDQETGSSEGADNEIPVTGQDAQTA